jgi:hypothetical protein
VLEAGVLEAADVLDDDDPPPPQAATTRASAHVASVAVRPRLIRPSFSVPTRVVW